MFTLEQDKMYTMNKLYLVLFALVILFAGWKLSSNTEGYPNVNELKEIASLSTDPVLKVLAFLEVDLNKTKKIAKHFPNPENWDETAKGSYESAFKSWANTYPDEFKRFANQESISAKSFGWESIGLTSPYNTEASLNSIAQASKALSAKRLKEIAPNLPIEKHTGNRPVDVKNYEDALNYWQTNYPHEYEAWLNAPEIMALKPEDSRQAVSLGYQDALPDFMAYADIEAAYPKKYDTDCEEFDQLNHAKRVQHWFFVYQANEYEKNYGEFPQLPEDFDLKRYRESYKGAAIQDDTKRLEVAPKTCSDPAHNH